MSGISSTSGSIAQILGPNSQAAAFPKGSEDTHGIEGLGGFSIFAMSGATFGSSDAMSGLAPQKQPA